MPQLNAPDNLRQMLDIRGLLLMYVGNLEAYQGIDLLLKSFEIAYQSNKSANLIIIGGEPDHIQKYQAMNRSLGIMDSVHLIGARPVQHLSDYLEQADILVSPRIKGTNTPMKLYSYLGSGKATIVTNMPTHTQLVDSSTAMIADPHPDAFAQGLLQLMVDAELRLRLGKAGQKLVEENFSHTAFCKRLNKLMDWLESELVGPPRTPTAAYDS